MADQNGRTIPYLSRAQISAQADEIRRKYLGSDNCPVDVEFLWENALGKEIRPIRGLGGRGTEAVLFGDLQTIAVDEEKFLLESYQNRMRFSIAHEIGHFFLHCSINERMKFENQAEWIQYYNDLSDDDYKWLEWQANEFAGRLLVPLTQLNEILTVEVKRVTNDQNHELLQSPVAIEFVASIINRAFGVSSAVISRRITAENLWPPQ